MSRTSSRAMVSDPETSDVGPQGTGAGPEFTIRAPRAASGAPLTLTADQQRVVDHVTGPLLVVAGPGTGKTSVLIEAAVARIEQGAPVDSVLVLTTSRRAAIDVRRRIGARLGRTTVTPLVFTFHSFCLALLRRFADRESIGAEVRLLSAPEQEVRLRETLAGSTRRHWPADLGAATDTRAFLGEIRGLLARSRQWGMDPVDLRAVGRSARRSDWIAVGDFFEEYLDILDAEQVLDYAELVHRCRILLADPAVLQALRAEIDWVYLDEFGETDPAQVALIAALVGGGGHVVAAGDPDQSIFGFRGGRGRAVLDFAERFTDAEGGRARIVSLDQSFRGGPTLRAACARIAARLPLGRPLPVEVLDSFRRPGPGPALDRLEVVTCVNAGAEAEHIAGVLRRAHLDEGVPWSEMAVLVRQGRRTIPVLARALGAAGVPVEVAGDEIPLASELAVRPLLMALRVASTGRNPDADEVARLLLSPLGGLDSLGVRHLGRSLRAAEQAELNGAGMARPSGQLIRLAVTDPTLLDDVPDDLPSARARRLAELLIEVESMIIEQGATASEALWRLWTATSWPRRLQEAALGGGTAARRANRDLDAVCALFAMAQRSEENLNGRGVSAFLAEIEAQQIPGDTLIESAVPQAAVRVLTAHRAKGGEWPVVVVASVQEGLWPDLRARGSLLQADRLTPYGLAEPEPVATRIAEERRLFHVACSRATQRLLVTAVEGTDGEGDQPSRFLAELGEPIRSMRGRPARAMSLDGLTAELRRVSADADEPVALRRAAAQRLARLADAVDDRGRPLVRLADPDSWWGMHPLSGHTAPGGSPLVRLSGSQLGQILACPRSWFLARRVGAERGRTSAANFGSVLHVLIEHAQRTGDDPRTMADHLDQVWDQIAFDATWLSGVERIEAEVALDRFAGWQARRTGHQVIGVEVPFTTVIEVSTGPVQITGTIDRLERDDAGQVHVIDFKTSRATPPRDAATHDQLGLYQLAVHAGGVAGLPPGTVVGGAELVFLRHGTRSAPGVAVSVPQAPLGEVPWPEGLQSTADSEPTWVHQRLRQAAEIIGSQAFPAVAGEACQWCQFAASCPARSRGRQVVA